jgi:hypothetical protein
MLLCRGNVQIYLLRVILILILFAHISIFVSNSENSVPR